MTGGFTLRELAHEAALELGFRSRVYPRLVIKGTLTQLGADRKIRMMEAIAQLLADKAEQEEAQERLL